MVNIFPDLLSLGLLSPLIIRVMIGIYFLILGWSLIQNTKNENNRNPATRIISGFVGILGGLCSIIGLFTQISGIVLAMLALYEGRRSVNKLSYILLFGMSLSLIFSGAGFFAFDLPL